MNIHKKYGKIGIAVAIGMALMLGGMSKMPALAAGRPDKSQGPERAMQSTYRIISEGDRVDYSDCYVFQEVWETVNPPMLTPSVCYQVTDAYRYEKPLRKRIMELTDGLGNKQLIPVREIAFVSAAVGGKESDFDNGHGLTPVPELDDITEWKLTIKNPYHEKNNPNGVREPNIKNITRQGDCVVFDYEDLYSTGNSYLSAVIYNKNKSEVIAYDRLVSAYERGNGTTAIYWPTEYDKNHYVLEVFAEKYNGDRMTDYISNMRMVYRGVDTKIK